jgi:glycerol-3-phosphate acyltransferase PlsY
MTLLIAGLLIYNFHMEWWWYAIAVAAWIPHTFPMWAQFFD